MHSVGKCFAGLCEHKWREHVEGWCTSGLILAAILPDSDHDHWKRMVLKRGDGWILTQQDSPTLFTSFKVLHAYFNQSRDIADGSKLWRQFLDMKSEDAHYPMSLLLAHMSTCYPKVQHGLVFEHLFCWVTFIQDRRLSATCSSTYGIGIVTREFLAASTIVSVGPLLRVFVGSRSYDVFSPGCRQSAIHNHLIMGPLSLLNHACRQHCNVDSAYDNDDLMIIRDVNIGGHLLTEYADEDYVKEKFNIQCIACCIGTCTYIEPNKNTLITVIFSMK